MLVKAICDGGGNFKYIIQTFPIHCPNGEASSLALLLPHPTLFVPIAYAKSEKPRASRNHITQAGP